MSARATRGKRATAEQATATATITDESQDQPGKYTRENSNTNSTHEIPPTGASETIGSRLRKRRRTDSSPTEDTSPAPKRAQSQKAAPATRQRSQAKSSNQDVTNGVAPDPPDQAMDSMDSSARGTVPIVGDNSTSQPQAILDSAPAQGLGGPDFNTVIADIINHGETVDNHYASRGYSTMGMGYSGHLGASFTLKTQSLPVLENLATQILEIMAKSTYHEILTIATKPDTDPGQAYATLKSLFDHTKKVYSVQEPFLNPYELGLVDNGQVEIIRKANMATFVSSVFGSQDVGFYHLNENFVDTFVADAGRLLKNQAQLFLDLKTQAYISAVQNTDRSREEILEDLFPHDLDNRLMKRRPGAKQLAPSEAEFVQRASNRRKALLEEASNQVAIKKLPEKYVWEDFLRDVSAYVSKNFEAIAGVAALKPARSQHPQVQQTRVQQRVSQRCAGQQTSPMQQSPTYNGMPPSTQLSIPQPSTPATRRGDIAEKAAQAAHYAMQDISTNQGPSMPHQYQQQNQPPADGSVPGSSQQAMQNTPQIQYHFEHPLHPNVPAPPPPYFQNFPYQHPQQQWDGHMLSPGQPHPAFSDQVIPYPTQSAPTQVLYERARMAATTKTSPSNRRIGHPSQRRPWTTEEESCLMAGLDRVKGPHWSQILAMFGPGGTISEVLKDRNQVQLKDKARNLKLFFLKSGIEVPYYLQFVTGELKTRAPAQAAKNEAKGNATTDEDRAHVEGLMALAGSSAHESDQPGTFSGNANVPMADMGVGMPFNTANGNGVLIDPEVTATLRPGLRNPSVITDASTDGIGEFALPNSEPLHRSQTNGAV